MPLWQAGLFIIGFYVCAFEIAPEYLDDNPPFDFGRWASMLPVVVVFGAYLVYRTGVYSKAASYVGTLGIFSAVLALVFRTVDTEGLVCDSVPMGTHFLWHIFLSAAAFAGLLAMIFVISSGGKQARTAASAPAGAPAE
jgi:hypothetical protein